jgi:hypothetical protein
MWPEPMNLARYIHRLTNEYTWWYICRLTDECIGGLDEHSNFIPVALFSPPTHPRHCSELESRTHRALNPPRRHHPPPHTAPEPPATAHPLAAARPPALLSHPLPSCQPPVMPALPRLSQVGTGMNTSLSLLPLGARPLATNTDPLAIATSPPSTAISRQPPVNEGSFSSFL